jgi:hypothetical protein
VKQIFRKKDEARGISCVVFVGFCLLRHSVTRFCFQSSFQVIVNGNYV